MLLPDTGPLHTLLELLCTLSPTFYFSSLRWTIISVEKFQRPFQFSSVPLFHVCVSTPCNYYPSASSAQNTARQQKWCQCLLSIVSPAVATVPGTQLKTKTILLVMNEPIMHRPVEDNIRDSKTVALKPHRVWKTPRGGKNTLRPKRKHREVFMKSVNWTKVDKVISPAHFNPGIVWEFKKKKKRSEDIWAGQIFMSKDTKDWRSKKVCMHQ